MNWIIISVFIFFLIIVVILLVFRRFYNDKNVGRKFLFESKKPFNKIAPAIYYDKQMLFRKYYGLLILIHYFFTVMSVFLTTLTIYMVMDSELDDTLRLVVTVLAAVCTNLQMILQFDKMAEAYIVAIRILEDAIIRYEQIEETSLEVLIEANKKAEDVIHNKVQ